MEPNNHDDWRVLRDQKVLKMLDPDSPAWLIEEGPKSGRHDMDFFSIVHHWGPNGWGRRRYMYDTIADVLHFWGTTSLDESDLAKLKPEQRFAPSQPDRYTP